MGTFFNWKGGAVPVVFIVSLILSTSFVFITTKPQPAREVVDQYYLTKIDELKRELVKLSSSTDIRHAREYFQNSRLIYKRIEFLVEYYNIYQARLLNGAALLKVEDDNPKDTIYPHGLQVLETYLYPNQQTIPEDLSTEVTFILSVIEELKNEEDRKLKYSDATIFDALRLQVFRIMTLGITGFDSPIAVTSIQEATSSMQSISDIVRLYENELHDKAGTQRCLATIKAATDFLKVKTDFNKFDRLTFTKEYLNPIAKAIVRIAAENNFKLPPDRRPLFASTTNLFALDALDLNFFSPNEQYRVTEERVALGKKLFYDPILSSSGNRSCGSCHDPKNAFADGLKLPRDVNDESELNRNTPTLLNSVYQTRQFYDMRTSKLENQLSDVVHNSLEMGGSLKATIPLLQNQPDYKQMFEEAYQRDEVKITEYNIANAISSYVRTLTSLDSRFDEYMRDEEVKLSNAEKNGFNLFMGKAKCGTCHFAPFFNGLVPPSYAETESEVLGVPSGADKKKAVLDTDPGRAGFTKIPLHQFAFKTPTLRNIELTAPYMHNGVYQTLEEVIDFYDVGGGTGLGIAPSNQTLPPDKLNLTKKEKREIVRFLKTLTGKNINK